MTSEEKFHLKKLINRIRELNCCEAHCTCGRHYRLLFDLDLRKELDTAEAIVDSVGVTYLEVD